MRALKGALVLGAAYAAGIALAGDSESSKPKLPATNQVLRSPMSMGMQVDQQSLRNSPSSYAKQNAPGIETAGGDDCASATVIAGLPYTDTGSTAAATDNYNEVCPFTNTGGRDVVYSYTPAANGNIDIDLCPSLFDTKVYVYAGSCPDTGNAVACNDDACGTSGFRSQILGLAVTGGTTYYIVVDAYSAADSGSYTLTVDEAAPPPECPPGSLFSQVTDGPADAWVAGTSEQSLGFKRWEDYSGVAGAINGLTFWGISAVNSGFGFLACTEAPTPMEVVFYADSGGAPGAAVCTYNVNATVTGTGQLFAGFELNEYSVALPAPCVNPNGWVSIQGQGDPNCWFLWMSSGGDGGGSSRFFDGAATVVEPFNLSLCLQGVTGGIVGSCCDDLTGSCQDNVDISDCEGRFTADTLCADISPACGEITGACCFDDGNCSIITEADCIADGGNWLGANTSCAACPCVVPCPPGSDAEGEPICGPEYNDIYNGGCNSVPPIFQPIDCGDTICGTAGTFPFTDPNLGPVDFRDTDWYTVTVVGETELVWTVEAEFPAAAFILTGDAGCGGTQVVASANAAECTPITLTACVPGGTYWVLVLPSVFDGVACGAEYTASLSCSPCVIPRGACCLPDGSCTPNTTEAECAALSGVVWTEGAGCDPNPCPQPPDNDNCDDCEPITVPFNTSINTSQASGGLPVASCNSSFATVTDNDVWYCYTPDEDCLLNVVVDPNYDGITAIYTGPSCNDLTELACADEPEPHNILLAATAGTTYYIQIGDWGSSPFGGPTQVSITCEASVATGSCCLPDGSCAENTQVDCFGLGGVWTEGASCDPNPCPQPTPGDNCSTPIVVTLPEEFPYNDVNSTCGRVDDYDATCMGNYDGGEDIIYELVVTAPVCIQVTLDANTIWAGIGLDDSCPLAGAGCIATSTTSADPDVLQATLAPGTYYMMIDTWPAPDCADFTLNIVECPPPPAGETCDVAVEIPSVPHFEQFNNDTAAAGAPGGSCNSGVSVMQNDLWRYYVADSNCQLTLTVNPTNYDGLTVIYSGPDCNNLTPLACGDEPEPYTITFQATAGTTYWFQTGDWGSSEGGGPTDFTLDCILCGDLDGDRDVDTNDFSSFVAAYGSCVGDGNYDAAADYDSDGCVELEDYQAWVQCYRDANPGPGSAPAPRLPKYFRPKTAGHNGPEMP